MTTPTPQLRHTPYGLRADAPVDRPHPILSLFITLLGVTFIAFPLGTSWGTGLFSLLTAAPFVLFGVVIVLIGGWVLIGSKRVIVKRGKLKLWYGVGPIGGAIPLPQDDLERLRVRNVSSSKGGGFDMPYELIAELSRDGKKGMDKIQLIAGAEPAVLIECGHAISKAIGVECAVARGLEQSASADQAAKSVQFPPSDAAYPEPPATSPFTLEAIPGHVTLYAAMDADAKRRSKSFIGMGVVFIVMIVAVGGGFIYTGAYNSLPVAIGLGSISLLFLMIGITMLGYGVLTTRDKWIIDITGGELLATFTHLGRMKSRRIPVAEIRSIRVEKTGESWGGTRSQHGGPSRGGIPVMELRIAPKRGPKLGVMKGCSNISLEWACEVLTIATGLEEADPDPDS